MPYPTISKATIVSLHIETHDIEATLLAFSHLFDEPIFTDCDVVMNQMLRHVAGHPNVFRQETKRSDFNTTDHESRQPSNNVCCRTRLLRITT